MKRALALLAFIATPALAGIPSVPHSLDPYEECVHKLTGLPIPATPPHVIYSDEWSAPISANGDCCDEYGQRVFRSRSYSVYHPVGRTIIIYRSARPSALVHELAADAYWKAYGNLDPLKREAIGYEAERRANIDCEGLE